MSISDASWAVIAIAFAFVVWLVLIDPREKETECAARCFRHQSRPRIHVPCSRCQDSHPLS